MVAAGQARPLSLEERERGEARRHGATEGWPLGKVLRHVEGKKKRRKKDAVVRVGRALLRKGCESVGG